MHLSVPVPSVTGKPVGRGTLEGLPDRADEPRTPERNAEPAVTAPNDDLRLRLPGLTLEDGHRLGRRLDGLRKVRDPQARERQRQGNALDAATAEASIGRARAAGPAISYGEDLPVSARRD